MQLAAMATRVDVSRRVPLTVSDCSPVHGSSRLGSQLGRPFANAGPRSDAVPRCAGEILKGPGYAREVAHYLFNFVRGDAAKGSALHEQAAGFLRLRMWGIDADEFVCTPPFARTRPAPSWSMRLSATRPTSRA